MDILLVKIPKNLFTSILISKKYDNPIFDSVDCLKFMYFQIEFKYLLR